MEDGMVAIVQGLEDCGLSVTVVNRRQFANSLRSNSPDAGCSTSPRAIEYPDRGPVNNTASQITDGHYTSTYQVAHCNVRPTTPRDYVTEFPPQRPERCPNQGNFQIGTGGYSMAPEASRARNLSVNEPSSLPGQSWLNDSHLPPTHHYDTPRRVADIQPAYLTPNSRISPTGRESPTSPLSPPGRLSPLGGLPPTSGRLSSITWASSPIPGPADSNQFANSLRSDPLASPDPKGSSELVQKLLNYTQNNHMSKMSMQRTRSPHESPTRDVTAKNIQTYTRSKIEPTKDPGPSITNKIQSIKSQKENMGANLPATRPISPWGVLTPCRSISPKRSNSPKRSTSPRSLISPMRSKSPKRSTASKRTNLPKRSTSPRRTNTPERSTSPNMSTLPKRSTSPNRINSPESISPRAPMTPYKKRNSPTYDYLKIGEGRLETSGRKVEVRYLDEVSGRKVEVRYLDDVRKCIRDTLKRIYEDTPPAVAEVSPRTQCQTGVLEDVKKLIKDTFNLPCKGQPVLCPNVNRRYCRHREMFHGDNDKGFGTEAELKKKTERSQETEPLPLGQGFFSCKAPIPQCSWHVPARCSCKKKHGPCICESASKDPEELKLGAKVAEETFNWVNDLPVYADEASEDKVIREEMTTDLVNNLKKIIGDPDFENKARKLIMECIEQLPIWYPGGKKKQETFKNQITDELVRKLNMIVDKMTAIVDKFINNLEFTDYIDKGEVVNKIVKRLKPLADRPEDMETEIKDILQDFMPISNKAKVIEKMVGKLVDDISSVAADEVLEKETKNWVNNTPELSNGENNTKVSSKLAKQIRRALNRELDDSKYQEIVREIVDDWIEEMTSGKNKLSTRIKTNRADDVVKKLKPQEKFKPKRRDRSSANQEYMNVIWNWLENDVAIPEENRKKYEESVNDLAKKLQELQSSGAREDKTAEKIMNFLDYYTEKGETIVNKDKLAKKLAADLKKTNENPSSLEQYEDCTSKWLSEIVGEENREKYKGPAKELAKKLKQLSSIGADDDEIEDEIQKFYDYLTEKGETIVNKDQLAKKLASELKKTNKKPSSLEQYEDCTLEWITEIVGEENREKYKGPAKELAKKLEQLSSIGADDDEIEDEIQKFYDYLTEKGETIVNIDKLSKKLAADLKKTNENQSSLEQYEDCTSEWLTEIVGEENREKYKGPAKKLAKKLEQLLSIEADDDEIEDEIQKFYDYLTNEGETIVKKDNLAKKLLKDITSLDEQNKDIPKSKKRKTKGDEKFANKKKQGVTSSGSSDDETTGVVSSSDQKKTSKNRLKDKKSTYRKPSLKDHENGDQELLKEKVDSAKVKSKKSKGRTSDDETTDDESVVKRNKIKKKLVTDLKKTNEKLSSLEQYEDRTSEWLTEIVGEENKEKYKGPAKELAKKLEQLLSVEADDDEIEDEIQKFYDYLTNEVETVVKKDNLAKKLVKDIISLGEQNRDIPNSKKRKSKGDGKFSNKKKQGVKSSGSSDDETTGVVSSSDQKYSKNRLKDKKSTYRKPSLKYHENGDQELLKEKVDSAKVKSKKSKGRTSDDETTDEESVVKKNKNKKNLATDLKKRNEKLSSLEQYEDCTSEWQTEIVGEENREKYKGPAKELAKKLEQLLSVEADDDEIEDEIQKFYDYLTNEVETVVKKDYLAKKLVKDIISLGEQNRDIPNSKKRKSKGDGKFSNKKKQGVKSSGSSDDETTGVVSSSDQKYSKNRLKDKKSTYRKPSLKYHENGDQELLKEKVASTKVKSKKSMGRTSDDETTDEKSVVERNKKADRKNEQTSNILSSFRKESILKETSDLIADLPSNISKSTRKELKNYIADILTESFNNLTDENNKALENIKNLLTTAGISDKDASKTVSAIYDRVKCMRIPNSPTDQTQYSKSIDRGNIHDIMKEFDIQPHLKTDLVKCLTDLDAGTVSTEKAKRNLGRILQEDGLSATDANYMAEMLLMDKNLTLRTEDSVTFTKRKRKERSTLSPKELSPMQRENFVEIAENDISNMVNDLTKDDSPEARKIIEGKSRKLAEILGEIISDPTIIDKKNAALGHIKEFFNDIGLETNTPTDELTNLLADRFLNIGFQTSTPKNERLLPHRQNIDNSSHEAYQSTSIPAQDSNEFIKENFKGVKRKSADILFDDIEDWCEKLPFKSTSPQAKQEIASKLINKIGELNMNPEVFNDEFLYNQMFEDELDNLLADMSSGDDKKNLAVLKKNLLEKAEEARKKTQEEIAGQTYKHQLRETISKNVPFQTLSANERAAFEALKDILVDSFISLHYVGDNEEQKQNYKANIRKELSRFCDDYLQNHENGPLDTAKLNENLYRALKAIPTPNDETFIPEVEVAKAKEEVNKWVKELPLRLAGDEKSKVDKSAAVLAKKVRDIEKQNELEHNTDFDDTLTKAILQWTDKLPKNLDGNIKNTQANKLVDNLRKTREKRRVNADMRRSIDAELNKGVSCIEHCKIPCSQGILTMEDTQYLDQIRARRVSNQQKETGSQTATLPSDKKGHLTQEAGNPAEVVPRLIVKEYYWDTASSQFLESYSPFSREYPTSSPILSPCSPISSRCSPISLPRSPISPRQSPISCPRTTMGSSRTPMYSPHSPICSPRSPISRCSPIYPTTPESCPSHRLYSPASSNPRLGSPKHTVLSRHTPELDPCRSENRPTSYQRQATGYEYGHSPPSSDLSQRRPSRRLPDDHEPCSPCPFGMTDSPSTSYHRTEIPSAELHCRGHFARTMLGGAHMRPFRKFRGDRDSWRQKVEECVREQPFGKRNKTEGFSCCGNYRNRNEDISRCTKCCGIHCPFPSYMYFK